MDNLLKNALNGMEVTLSSNRDDNDDGVKNTVKNTAEAAKEAPPD